ncbi:hypothetical protein EYF80_023662 [Liparis tanakae]|uniref:Uncharacterized protein n=1 Tax=Liparis tanakae TaxID=230148 RepID=A0A4Z2HML5_9TELE|nr:hypothetical protein EYF80_023662 [Liparis tanakae]
MIGQMVGGSATTAAPGQLPGEAPWLTTVPLPSGSMPEWNNSHGGSSDNSSSRLRFTRSIGPEARERSFDRVSPVRASPPKKTSERPTGVRPRRCEEFRFKIHNTGRCHSILSTLPRILPW